MTRLLILGLGLLAVSIAGQAEDAASLKTRIAKAAKGETVQLPTGTFALGDLAVPDGVSLKGAGYQATIIDATGHDIGIALTGTAPAVISDLAVLNAAQAGIRLDGAAGATLERLLVRKCGSGVLVRKAKDCALRNLIVADNYAGVIFANSANCALVNCTVANSASAALRLESCERLAVFNNLFTFAATGISVSGTQSALAIDRNLYIANWVGRMSGETPRRKVEAWATLSGYDKHSLTLGVTYKDPVAGDYHPTSPLAWAPIRATTSDWGMPNLAGTAAPAKDIDGAPRVGGYDLGAFETAFPAPRPEDGSFKVTSGEGVTSAGLFTKDGRCVHYLFQNQPLQKGTYSFWLPARDWQGRPIAAGAYKLKVTEADMKLDYIAAAGNGDLAMSKTQLGNVSKRASLDPQAVAFDAQGRLVVAQSGFESGQHVRAYDPQMTEFVWSYPGGGNTVGLTVDGQGRALVMRTPASLIRLDAATGNTVAFANGSGERSYREAFTEINGMTWLGDKLYVADPKAGKLVVLGGENLDVSGSFSVPDVKQPAADAKTGLIWAISGGEIVAMDAQGAIKQRAKPVETPTLLAANNGRLAVYSTATRKIAVFDASAPAKLRPLFTIGTGDDGYGPIIAERFWNPRALAMSSTGEIAVADAPRTCLFAADGKAKHLQMGMWGQQISYGWFAGDKRVHFFNIGGGYDIILDAKARSWAPGTRWKYTMEVSPIFYFSTSGQNFGVFLQTVKDRGNFLALARMETGGVGRVLARYGYDKDGLFLQRDADADGVIKDTDPIEPIVGADGKRITVRLFDGGFANMDTRRDGSLAIPADRGMVFVPMTGLDAKGVPQYDFAHCRNVPGLVEKAPTYTSPYDLKTAESVIVAKDMVCLPDGGYVAALSLRSGPGPDPATEHANSTNLGAFDADGQLRWFSPMNPFGLKLGLHGITNIGGITVAGRGAICEFETMDADGLGTGVLGTPRAMGWGGMWLDNHRQVQGFTGNDGKPYLIVGDYAEQAYHWMALVGYDKVLHRDQTLNVTPALAATLAALPAEPVARWPVPPPPRVVIQKLPGPLPVDGDLAKWRALNIRPIVISADNPANNSAVVRIGHTDDALYVQIIKFDNLLTFHQTEPGKHYLQDGIELNIGTFWSGWKYNITRLTGKGDIILRDRFFGESRLLTLEEGPRVIKVLDSAVDVPERRLLEAAAGVDMSACKVMIIEFRLGKDALAGLPADRAVVFQPGKTFLLGMMINDNDLAGSDTMGAMVGWPVMYGAFSRDEDLATAVIE